MKTFRRPRTKNTLPNITPVIAQQIYTYFSQGLTISDCFKKHGVPFRYSKRVKKEVERLESEVDAKMRGAYVVTPEVTNGQGEITQEAVYFAVTTKASLTNSLSSNLLDISIWLNDYIKYDSGNFKEDRTWVQFKALYSE